MALFDSADIIRRVKLKLNRPATDTAFTVLVADDVLYDFGTEEQDEITKLCAAFIPDALITAPTALTSSDSGLTYTFANDADSAPLFAFGHYRVYPTRADIPDWPLEPGVDFEVENTKIRMTNHTARTFSDGGPWVQAVYPSNAMAAATQPTIPKICRTTLIHRIASRAADRLGLDPSKHDNDAAESWVTVLAAVKNQAWEKGGATLRHRNRAWWTRR